MATTGCAILAHLGSGASMRDGDEELMIARFVARELNLGSLHRT